MACNFDRASDQWIDVAGLPDFTSQFSFSARIRISQSIVSGEFFTVFSKIKDGNDRNIYIDYRVNGGVVNLELGWSQPAGTFIQYAFQQTLAVGTWFSLVWTADWTTNP